MVFAALAQLSKVESVSQIAYKVNEDVRSSQSLLTTHSTTSSDQGDSNVLFPTDNADFPSSQESTLLFLPRQTTETSPNTSK